MPVGTDILGILKDQCLAQSPEAVINIKTIHELAGIEENASGLTLGALTPTGRCNSFSHYCKDLLRT